MKKFLKTIGYLFTINTLTTTSKNNAPLAIPVQSFKNKRTFKVNDSTYFIETNLKTNTGVILTKTNIQGIDKSSIKLYTFNSYLPEKELRELGVIPVVVYIVSNKQLPKDCYALEIDVV